MAFEHAPLTEPELGPAVWKVVQPGAPAPLQTMVARGLAPLGPRDLVMALYQLWVNNTPPLAEQAAKTVTTLPPNILTAALRDPTMAPGALDFAARKLPRNAEALEALVRHPLVHDDTLVAVSRVCPESICDLLSENQERWLRTPAIVEALYQNPNCRMSVAQRMLELAVRQGVDLSLPNIEEIKQAIAGTPSTDAPADDEAEDEEFRRVAARAIEGQASAVEKMVEAAADEDVDLDAATPSEDKEELEQIQAEIEQSPDEALSLPVEGEAAEDEAAEGEAEEAKPEVRGDRITQISKLSPMKKIRLALLGNAFERAVLIRDSNKAVSLSAIKSPKVKENEVVAYCANRSLSHDVIRYISTRRDWVKLYAVKLNLVLNPKTPMASAMTLLGHLHAHDIKKVARSRNIPSALATAAKRRMAKRR